MIPNVRLRPVNQSMDQLVHDFNTALDETGGSNSSSRSSASRRKVSLISVLKSYENLFLCRPGRDDVRAPVISLSVTATTSVTTAAPVWTMLASCPGTEAPAASSSVTVTWRLRSIPAWPGPAGRGPSEAGARRWALSPTASLRTSSPGRTSECTASGGGSSKGWRSLPA